MFNIEHNSFSSVHLKLREKSSISNSTDNDNNNKTYKTRGSAERDETRKTKVVSMKEMWHVEKNRGKNKKPCQISGGKCKTLTQEINFKVKEIFKCGSLSSVVMGTKLLKGDSA